MMMAIMMTMQTMLLTDDGNCGDDDNGDDNNVNDNDHDHDRHDNDQDGNDDDEDEDQKDNEYIAYIVDINNDDDALLILWILLMTYLTPNDIMRVVAHH